MSLEDPFFAVKDEVFKALNKTRGLYLRWRELGGNSDGLNGGEAEWTTNELKNSLRSIEWDLEDLEDTITRIVEKNSHKFRIDSKELRSRRHFIDNTRDEVKQMKERMSLNRSKDRDITAHQPLLDEHHRQQQQIAKDSVNPNSAIVEQQQQSDKQLQQHLQQQQQSHLNHQHQVHQLTAGGHQVLDRSLSTEYPGVGGGGGGVLVVQTHSTALLNGNGGNSGNSCVGVGGVMANTLAGTMAAVRHSGTTRYSKLENALEDSPGHYHNVLESPTTQRFIGDTVHIQQRMLQNQDEQLEMISDSIGTLKTVSRQIGVELDEQAIMLDDFGNEFEITESKMDATMKKIAKVLHMNNDRSQWAAIIILTTLLVIVIILFIIW